MANPTGQINGSDLLIFIGTKAIGHCTTHTLTFNTETKESSFKPAASEPITASKWTDKSESKKSVSISADGLRNFSEEEGGFKTLLAAWIAGTPVTVKGCEREKDTTPYISGSFIITSLTETSPANDDATYSISLENSGPVTITASALTGETTA